MTILPDSGYIAESEDFSSQPGLQRITGNLLATQGYVLGIEISGSGSRHSVALADLSGTVSQCICRSLEGAPSTHAALALLDEMIADVMISTHLAAGRLLRVGVAVGGLVDARQGIVRRLHHVHGWEHFSLQDYFAEKLSVPCIIDNNANAAALAEVVRGVGTGEHVVLYVGLGRGIGGGLVVNGHVYQGTTGIAGEIGHFYVKEDGPRCSCGSSGHLEAVASEQAIVHTMIGLSVEYPETEAAIQRITDRRAQRITVDQVFCLAEEGDQIAQHVVQDASIYLGNALANIVHLINPGMIILGGWGARVGERLIASLRERIQELCLPEASQSLRIVQGSLGSEANILGAVTLALQDL